MAMMPEYAPFVALAFLGTVFLVASGVLGIVVVLFTRSKFLVKWLIGFEVLLIGGYAIVLLAASFTSRQIILGLGQSKYFCEIDCHLAYSVVGVETDKTLGEGSSQITARGNFLVVAVKTWFDPATISPHRGNGQLAPNPRSVVILDEQGTQYYRSGPGELALAREAGAQIPLTQALRPGESYVTKLVFDVPNSIRNPRLWLTDELSDPIPPLLIGHERSLFHGKIYFSLTQHSSKVISP